MNKSLNGFRLGLGIFSASVGMAAGHLMNIFLINNV